MTDTTGPLARVAPSERIANLDVLRGVAILAILLMNIPYMAGYAMPEPYDPRLVSWTAADQATFRFVSTFLEGTQRGLLEMLFGAGIMIMTRAAMSPSSPVAVADLHFRRNLWLIAFGVFQALVLMWPGDILFPYGLVAVFVFAFRTLKPRTKLVVGALAILLTVAPGAMRYQERVQLKAEAAAAAAKVAAHKPVSKDEQAKLDSWKEKVAASALPAQSEKKRELMAKEKTARLGGLPGYWAWTTKAWLSLNFEPQAWFWLVEIFGTMLIGAALYEWGVLPGQRSAGFYVALFAVGYGLGGSIRTLGVAEELRFDADPRFHNWITWDLARLALVLGHVGLINLALKSRAGQWLLKPFQATGRMPLTIYLGASIICMMILFPGFGFGLWGRYGWAGMETIALVVMAAQLVFANVWLMFFETGPIDWLWKSLAYRKRQPFLKPRAPAAVPVAAE